MDEKVMEKKAENKYWSLELVIAGIFLFLVIKGVIYLARLGISIMMGG